MRACNPCHHVIYNPDKKDVAKFAKFKHGGCRSSPRRQVDVAENPATRKFAPQDLHGTQTPRTPKLTKLKAAGAKPQALRISMTRVQYNRDHLSYGKRNNIENQPSKRSVTMGVTRSGRSCLSRPRAPSPKKSLDP